MKTFTRWQRIGVLAAALAAAGSFQGRAARAEAGSASCIDLPDINLLANPGADDGPFPSTSLPEGWAHEAWREEGVSFTWDNTVSHGGSKSARISADTVNDASWTRTVQVEPYTTYVLSGWIKTEGVTHTGEIEDAGANLSFFGTWTHTVGVFGTQDWTHVSVPFDTGPAVEVTIAARLGYWAGTSAGTAWYDDIKVEAAGEDAMVNGGFERGLFVENGPAPAWTPSAQKPKHAALAWDDAVSADGDKSLRIDLDAPGTAAWSQRVVVRPHTRYKISGWVKTDDVHVEGSKARRGARLAVPELDVASQGIAGTHGWKRVKLSFDTGDLEVITIEARLGRPQGGATGAAWFDALELVPRDPPESPRWRILGLVYGETDFVYTAGDGSLHHLSAAMSEAERDRAATSLRRFVGADVPALTSGSMIPSLTICFPEEPLDDLDAFFDGYWPSPSSTAPELRPDFDSAVVIWDPSGVDLVTGQEISVANAGGLTPPMGTGQTYTSIIIDALSDQQRNALKHEWGHSILFYHEAAGTAPLPTVDNHLVGNYVHCQSGEPYVLVDETDDEPVPWSIYNNELGFTRDYYSGRTALAADPTRCLGITPEAWASGGPISK